MPIMLKIEPVVAPLDWEIDGDEAAANTIIGRFRILPEYEAATITNQVVYEFLDSGGYQKNVLAKGLAWQPAIEVAEEHYRKVVLSVVTDARATLL